MSRAVSKTSEGLEIIERKVSGRRNGVKNVKEDERPTGLHEQCVVVRG